MSEYTNIESQVDNYFSSVTENHTIEKKIVFYLFFLWGKLHSKQHNNGICEHFDFLSWILLFLTVTVVMQSNFVTNRWSHMVTPGRQDCGREVDW